VTGKVTPKKVEKKVETEEYKKYKRIPAFRDQFGQMKLILKSDEVAGEVTQSVVHQIAAKAKNIKGRSIFGPLKGIQPGAIRPFEMIEGPGNMVQWESRCGSDPRGLIMKIVGDISIIKTSDSDDYRREFGPVGRHLIKLAYREMSPSVISRSKRSGC
jgi:hypothetical protein